MAPFQATEMSMTCERYREAASARLDSEPLGVSASALEHHLATCVDCAAWVQTASQLGRSYRVSRHTPPDLTASILDQVVLPAARVRRYRRRLRLSLGALGFVQWALAMPALFGDTVGMSMGMHASHESAAWNIALGASFVAVAIKPVRAVGTLPILATFVAVLGLLSIPDLAAGAVQGARLASHAGVVLGLVCVALVSRSQRTLPPGADVVVNVDEHASLRSIHRSRGAA
jgi:predicted anti-sigma-YlaC factor YlaD